jgi:cytoskeletal protein RodZ
VFEIGSTLREARVRRSLTLQQVEEDTKIRVKYLQAMENEDFDVMPGPTYAKAFLRTYSSYLGLDANVMLQEYSSRGAQRDHEPFGGSSMLGAPRSHRGRNTIVFIAVICLLVLGVIYVLGMGSGGEGQEPVTQPSVLGVGSPSPSPSPKASPSPTRSATPAAGVVRISAADGDCWLEVRVGSSTGRVLYSSTMNEGATKVFRGKALWLRLGNPPAVRINVDGARMPRIAETGPLDYLARNGKLTRQD